MPPPPSLPAAPMAHPLLPKLVVVSPGAVSGVVSGVVSGDVSLGDGCGGWAVAMGSIRLPALAKRVMSLRLAYRSVVVIGCTQASPAHHP